MLVFLHFVLLSVAFVDGSISDVEDCTRSTGVEYRGKQQSASSGLACLIWTNTDRDYDVTSHTETGVGDHNYCRNPDSSERPWCYISGPDGLVQRQFCPIDSCKDQLPTTAVATEADPLAPAATTTARAPQVVEPAKSGGPAQGEVAAVQPVMGVSQRVRTGPRKKKDLGVVGYVIGILMMAVIIMLGVGITIGYFYKRGRDLKKQHKQRVYEREMQRITLPLSAFSNPTCELVDEDTVIIITAECPPAAQEGVEEEGGDPLMGQQAESGTPGA